MQLKSNDTSSRLTPQGFRRPMFVTGPGVRSIVFSWKAEVVLTNSDRFNSLKAAPVLAAPMLRQKGVRRRSARIVHLGFSYMFGKPTRNQRSTGGNRPRALTRRCADCIGPTAITFPSG